jgi:hypothetical protein
VTIQGLIAELGAGMTPVREAIRRLTAEGALLPQGNRRVAVPPMTAETLDQLAFARLSIEPHLAERAAARLTPALIARLAGIDDAVTAAMDRGDIPAYLQANHAFHFALYEAADAPVLLDLARSLWLRAGPSLRAVIGRFGRRAAGSASCRAGGDACGRCPGAGRRAGPRHRTGRRSGPPGPGRRRALTLRHSAPPGGPPGTSPDADALPPSCRRHPARTIPARARPAPGSFLLRQIPPPEAPAPAQAARGPSDLVPRPARGR